MAQPARDPPVSRRVQGVRVVLEWAPIAVKANRRTRMGTKKDRTVKPAE